MDFEKAYKNFINGTATPEETEFVRSEMKKASDINGILTNVKSEGASSPAEKETVRRAMKAYLKKDTLKILLIVCCSVLVLAIGAACAVGIPILNNAKGNTNYTENDARAIAVAYLTERYPDSADNIEVRRVERELEVEGRIKHARYIYVVDVYNGADGVIEIEVDSKTGKIVDVD